jgi:S1-C subfamily serine protease
MLNWRLPTQAVFPRPFFKRRFAVCLLLLIFAVTASAQIYKYKDSNGRWQYSDKPPAKNIKTEQIESHAKRKSEQEGNLKRKLTKKYRSVSAIEKTTLAVVRIETPLGLGSGFFTSSDGYILTNKHVVRPDSDSVEEAKDKLKKSEAVVQRQKSKLRRYRDRLKSMKRDLDEMASELEYYSDSDKVAKKEEYSEYRRDYFKSKKNTEKFEKNYKKNARELQSKKDSFNRRLANAEVANQFDIFLKDKTKLTAKLVGISSERDLALLKLSDHFVPTVVVDFGLSPKQGEVVYAVGSPLGLHDYVTSGVITSFKKKFLVTDAQILPGNSGGPLVDPEGRLLGMNTAKLLSTNSIGSEGFGLAIPLKAMKKEFPQAFEPSAISEAEFNGEQPEHKNDDSLMDSILDDFESAG